MTTEQTLENSELAEWDAKFNGLLDAVMHDDVNVRLNALKSFINYDMRREMLSKNKLMQEMQPSVLAVDLALRTISVAATCKRDRELRFVVDMLARILCCGDGAKYEALKEAVKADGCKWRSGKIERDSVQYHLLQNVTQYVAEIDQLKSNQTKMVKEMEAQFDAHDANEKLGETIN
jgi:CRISPR/Cas system-associated endonuclease Cas3-HD